MKFWVLFAVLCAALLATPLWAQRGGGGGHGGMGGGHGFSGGHGFVGGAPRGGSFSGYHATLGNGGWHGNGWRGYGWRGYGYRNRFYGYYPWWGYGYGGWGWYPSWGWDGGFDYDSSNDYPPPDYYGPNQYAAAQPPPGYVYMTPQGSTATYASPGEVQKIQQEVDQLRAQQEKRDQASESSQDQTGTVLVYRDGYTETINNYAIVGNTVWVLNQNSAKKVALSELDLPATKRDNEERGTDFVVPKSSH